MDRLALSEAMWDRLACHLPGKAGDPGRSGADNRLFVEAVLWVARVGAPWRDLPDSFGAWNSAFRRFRRWAKGGVFERLFAVLSGDPDFEYVMVDGTLIRAHQHATGARGDRPPSGRTVARWPDHQGRGPRGRAWQPGPLCSAARPTS